MRTEFEAGDWQREASERGWPEDRIDQLEECAKVLDAQVTIIHSQVIVLENAFGGRFMAIRESGTRRGLESAHRALANAGRLATSLSEIEEE